MQSFSFHVFNALTHPRCPTGSLLLLIDNSPQMINSLGIMLVITSTSSRDPLCHLVHALAPPTTR